MADDAVPKKSRARRARSGVIWAVQPHRKKYSDFQKYESGLLGSPSRPARGALRESSRTLGWDAVDAAALRAQGMAGRANLVSCPSARGRTELQRTAKACGPGTRCWCQVGEGSRQPNRARGPSIRRRWWQDEFVARESAPYAVKTIRVRECRVISGASAVNTRVHTSLPPAHTGLRVHWAPGIPHALCLQKGESFRQNLGRMASRGAKACLQLRGKAPHSQPSSSGLTGRSSFPETSVMESMSRGELDTPHRAGYDDGAWEALLAIIASARN